MRIVSDLTIDFIKLNCEKLTKGLFTPGHFMRFF